MKKILWALTVMCLFFPQRRWIPGLSDKGVDSLPEDVMNHVISGDDDYTRDLARLLNIDLSDPAQKVFIYAMEYMKYGNMNVIHILTSPWTRVFKPV